MVAAPALAQLDNHYFYDNYNVDSSCDKTLRIGTDFMPLIKNNEYFNPIIEGYTLFGYQFKPYLSVYPSSHVRVDGGIYLLRYFGSRGFDQVKPYFMLKYQLTHFSIIFGDIEGTLNHGMIEPLYDFERIISHRMEEGLQVKWESSKLHADSWLNWENFIHPGDHAQEIFNAGLSAEYRILQGNNFTVDIPLQLLARHHGGQINISNAPVFTVYNSTEGLKGTYMMSNSSPILNSILIEGYHAGYSAPPGLSVLPFSRGHGWLAGITLINRFADLNISYWKGHDFYSPIGTPMYQSLSLTYDQDHYTEPERDLLFFHLTLKTRLSGSLNLLFRFEPIYDLANNHWDHSESLYLRFNTDWHVLKL